MTPEMWSAMPDGGSVCYMEGHTYHPDSVTVVTRDGVNCSTYTWGVCSGCDTQTWVVTRVVTVSGPTHHERYDCKDGRRWVMVGVERAYNYACACCADGNPVRVVGVPDPDVDWRDVEVGAQVPLVTP